MDGEIQRITNPLRVGHCDFAEVTGLSDDSERSLPSRLGLNEFTESDLSDKAVFFQPCHGDSLALIMYMTH
jgi:hypothetical protein